MTERLDSTGKIVTVVSSPGEPRELLLFLPGLVLVRLFLLRPLPALDRDLFAAGQRQLACGSILGDRRSGPRVRALFDRHRRNQHVAGSDMDIILDRSAMLVGAVVVHRDRARTDVDVTANDGVAEVGEMIRLGACT